MPFFVVNVDHLQSSSIAGRVVSTHPSLVLAMAACRAPRPVSLPPPPTLMIVESPLDYVAGECIDVDDVARGYSRDGLCILDNVAKPRDVPGAQTAPGQVTRSTPASSYDAFDDAPTTQFSIHRVKARRPRGERLRGRDPERDYSHLRRARPSSEPLPVTFKWIARLPREVRPLALLRQFPRVANELALRAREPEVFRAYLYDLLVDRRGNRKGFPKHVEVELLGLRKHFAP